MEPQHNIQEVTIHYKRPDVAVMPKIHNSKDAESVMRSIVDVKRLDHKEFFWVILLNRANQVLGVAKTAEGSTEGVSVNVREIFQLTITSNATGIILCHNHPSGSLKPSQADISITKRIQEFAKLLDVVVMDHMILTTEGYYSFVDEGIMNSC